MSSQVSTTESTKNSRVGKKPIVVPEGVDFTISRDVAKAKGSKGTLERKIPEGVRVERENGKVHVYPEAQSAVGTQYQGLVRALISNMFQGVSEGYASSLDLHGVGYRAEISGQALKLSLGLSHVVTTTLPDEVKARVETIDEGGQKRPRLHLTSVDKELLGQVTARIKSFRPPEPYKGKGVRLTGERIREKAGKAGAKGKK